MRKLILVLSMVVGLAAAVLGPLLGAALAAMAWVGRARESGSLLQAVTIAAGLSFCSLAFGLALAWTGWAAERRPRLQIAGGWWLLTLGIVLGLGQAAFSAGIEALVPVAHIAPASSGLPFCRSPGSAPAQGGITTPPHGQEHGLERTWRRGAGDHG
jgi:hypothetical protein